MAVLNSINDGIIFDQWTRLGCCDCRTVLNNFGYTFACDTRSAEQRELEELEGA